MPEENRYDIFREMILREPEIAAALGDIDLPEDSTQVEGFYKDLKNEKERCDDLAAKIKAKYIEVEVVDAW